MKLKDSYFYSSPIGVLEIRLKDNKLYSISQVRSRKTIGRKNISGGRGEEKTPPLILSLTSKLSDYFSGKTIKNWSIPLYPQGTAFQRKVWKYLSGISYGRCCTYSKVAQAVGSPKAFRAVGSACGKNPWLIVVPCHRVVSQTGLGGFALGLKTKSRLLSLESH
ncbi:MAG: methylated-DNA--[protein]-cysteine S-methyltransferase [Bdellovibrionales bacterium]|nr:methylated-DNA--[protein]-cysteine S-methyltransferase [Bdellovibrionales bacterium]